MKRTRIVAVLSVLTLAFGGLHVGAWEQSAEASSLSLTFESSSDSHIVLGSLASRTQRKPITVGGASAPFTVTGSDSRGGTYQYQTDVNYSSIGRESDERGFRSFSFSSSTNSSYSDRTALVYLSSNGTCNSGNSFDSGDGQGVVTTYCAVFGPEIWTEPFDASAGQALSFDYAASASDNYEVYAFLVKVDDSGGSWDYGGGKAENSTDPLDTHTLILHRRGKTAAWTTASGSVPETGKYRFRFVDGAFDQTGGYALGTNFYIDPTSVVVGDGQTITFANPGDQVGASGTFELTASSSSGLAVTFASSTAGKCTVSGTTVTKVSTGTCTITANAAGSGSFVAANSVTRSFEILAAASAPSNTGLPTIFGSVTTGTTLTIDDGTWNTGGASITGTTYQWKATKSGVTSNIADATSATYCVANEADIIGSTLTVTVTKTNSVGSTSATSSATGTVTASADCAPPPAPPSSGGDAPAASPTAQTPTPTVNPQPRRIASPPPDPTRLFEPVLRGGVPPAPPATPTGTVGGRSVPIQTQVTSPTGFSLTAGVLNLGLQVQQDQGVVRQNNTGGTEIEVRKGSTAEVSGTGFLPRSTVQVFLPLQGANAKEIARIPVDEAGTFSGDAVFATRVNERPLPIGKQVLQVVSLDEDGQQSVVEMTVNIAQSAPAPEPDRTVGATPTLRPGQFLATNAGEPEIVTVVPVPEDRQARVEGDGWQMAVDIPSANGSVARSDEGGALLQLVRDETAVVSGTGFMPGTRADVWLFSEPTLLGTVDIDENGEFSGEVNIDSNVVVVGEHTLQLQGVGEDGYVRAANLGVVVNDTAAEATTEQAAGGFLWWLWLLVILVALVVWFAIWRYRRSREA